METDATGQTVMVDGKPKPLHARTSYFTPLHPFLALKVIFNDPEYLPPTLGDLPENLRSWPTGWALSRPQSFYPSFMFFLSFMLVAPSVVLLRRVAQSTVSIKSWILQKVHLSSGDRRRKPRTVWSNPIAWREAKTKASAARATLLRYGFIVAGIAAALVLVILYATKKPVDRYVSPGSYDPVSRKNHHLHRDQRPVLQPGHDRQPHAQRQADHPRSVARPLQGRFRPSELQPRRRRDGPQRHPPRPGGAGGA